MNMAIRVGRGTAKFKAVTTTLLAAVMLVGSCTCSAPRNVYAADGADLSAGALCAPEDVQLGDSVSNSNNDTGVATYVGRDMYIGANTGGNTTLTSNSGIDGSYAVEAEGLTVVNGKLAMNPLNNSWRVYDSDGNYNSAGFRFGTVGFGSQIRPASGPSLVVGGKDSAITSMETGGVSNATVGAWTKGAWTGQSVTGGYPNYTVITGSPAYTAQVAGAIGKWSTNQSRDAVVGQQNNWAKDDGSDGKAYADAMSVTGTNDDNSSYTTDYSQYAKTITDLSATLASTTGTQAVENNDNTRKSLNGVWRGKYNWGSGDTSWATYGFTFNDGQTEKVITFKGDKTSSMQYFSLPASMLSGNAGISFEFVDIPDTASVVINVTGAENGTVSFHNGWRVWWNGTDISDGYRTNADDKVKTAYAHVAQYVMWNFADAADVEILGGQGEGHLEITNVQQVDINNGATENGTAWPAKTTDDPAAAFLGSILVPRGNLTTHVSTNGRVWVGGDYSMYNPESGLAKVQKDGNWIDLTTSEGKTTSIIAMDQERHNFPWSGSYTESCSAIAWQKSDENGTALDGTTWAVYGTYADAKAGTNALLTVKDGSYYDKDSTAGSFTVEGLKNNATYYIKEVATGSDAYRLNTNIYYAATGNASDTPVKVEHSVADDGTTLGTTDMTSSGAIINKPSGHEVSWTKTADDTKEALAGSAWQIKLKDDQTGTKIWNIADNTSEATGVTAEAQSSTLNANNDWKTTLNATVEPSDALQQVNWTFTNAEGTTLETSSDAAVLAKTGDTTATITGISATDATVYVKACSVSNPDVCSNAISIEVKAANVTAFDIKDADGNTVNEGDAITAAAEGDELAFTASVTPSIPITWTSSNNAVATVTTSANGQNATVRMVGFGSATITVTAGNQTLTFTVKVPSTTVYFKKSLPNPGWSRYYLYYGDGTSSTWKFVEMTESCGDYVYVTIPKAAQGNGFVFRNRAETTGSDNWYKPSYKDDSHFTFTGNAVQVVELYNNSTGSTAPSGCAATVATMSAESTESDVSVAAAPATAETTTTTTNEATAGGTSKAASCTAADGTDINHPGVKCDTNTAPGQFTVGGLDAGTYLLHEITAPDGYTLNTTVYQFTIGADGTVEWNGGWADGDTSGSIDPELKPDAANGNAISDSPTEVTWYKVSSENISGDYLTGAQWELKRTADGSSAVVSNEIYCVVDGNGDGGKNSSGEPICPRSDATHASAIRLTDVSNTNTETGTVQNTADGIITLKGLKFGTYTLTETVAPDGYDLSTVTYTFTVNQDSSAGTVTIAALNPSDPAISNNKIPNRPGAELPDTGGNGIETFLVWGTLAVVVAVAGLALQVRRSRR